MSGPASNKKKICIVTPEFPPEQWGGLARTVGRVARHAVGMGLEVHVAHLNVEESPLVLLDENRTSRRMDAAMVHRIGVGRERILDGARDLWDCPHTLTLRMMYQSLEMLHREEEFGFFHSFFLYPVGFVTGMLARRLERPSMVTLVGNDIKKYLFSPEKVAVCRSGLENADRVTALSRDLVEMADALTPIQDKARIIYNSVEIPGDPWKPDRSRITPYRLGCAGIFKYAKGLPYLMKAVAQLGGNRKVTLELIGKLRRSEEETYETMARRTGIRDIVRFREALPHDEIPEWLRSLDAFVLPSVSEGCPNILMEAMAMGLPCVATRTGAVGDLMEDGVSGLIVPWGDSAALAAALETIIDHPDRAEAMGAAARRSMEDFSPERELDAWKEVYGELIDL